MTMPTTVVVLVLTNAEELEKGKELVLGSWARAEQDNKWKSDEIQMGKKKMKVNKNDMSQGRREEI